MTQSSNYKFELPQLPATGTYTVAIQPDAASAGTLNIQVLQDASAVLQPGVTSPLMLAPGQNGRYTFVANAGDSLGLACSSLSTTPAGGSVSISIRNPDGSYLWGAAGQTGVNGWQLPQMPATGTYSLLVQPDAPVSAFVTLLLSQPNSGVIAIDGPTVQFQNSSQGQSGRYAFSGDAGDMLGLGVSPLTITPSGGTVFIVINKPDGSSLFSATAPSATSFQLPQLPTTGTYTISVQPSGAVLAAVTLSLSRPIAGILATDGTTTTYQNSRVGQAGRYTFAGAAGRRYTMQVAAGPGFENTTYFQVFRPNGASVGFAQLYSNSNYKIDLGALPESGTYIVTIIPRGTSVGQATFRLVEGASDKLTIGDSPKLLTLGAGQNGCYTFTGSAGDLLGLGVTALSTTPASPRGALFIITKPDGNSLWNAWVPSPTSVQLPQLPATGTYTLVLQPDGTSAASATVLLSNVITGTLATDGTPTTYQIARAGQSGLYTFGGTAGQPFAIEATLGASGFENYGLTLNVSAPGGVSVGWSQFSSGTDFKIDLGTLPASGIYTVMLVPGGLQTGSVVLRLVGGISGTLNIGDPPAALVLGTAQNGLYAFSGNVGDQLSIGIMTISTTPANSPVLLSVLNPAGSVLWSSYVWTPASYQLPQLPAAGTYSLAIQPLGPISATITYQVTRR